MVQIFQDLCVCVCSVKEFDITCFRSQTALVSEINLRDLMTVRSTHLQS